MSRGDLRFSVDCRLLFELGEQLVARKSVALAELVKNAYDADATKAVVRLENVTQKETGRIVVEDNGAGMTLERIKKSWMRVATDEKERSPASQRFGRPTTGVKGIGRFASRRLADELLLRSVAKRGDGIREGTTARFKWKLFVAGRDIDKVPISYESRPVRRGEPSGVCLTLVGLREPWEARDVEELQRDLFSLVSPFPTVERGAKKDPGFSFELDAPEFPELSGRLEERFFEASWGLLRGRIDKKGRGWYSLRIRGGKALHFRSGRAFPRIGEATFRIHFFLYRSEFFEGLPFSVGEARQLASSQSGVRIYMDRFRVFPYGDPGDDWLDLDADRGRRRTALSGELAAAAEELARPMLQLPGNNQLFGAVFLSRKKNAEIALNISRERLLENEAFASLTSFVRLGIDWMTVQYARYGKVDRPKTAEASVIDPQVQLKLVRERIKETEEISNQARAQILQALDLAKEGLESREKERISELSMIRVLATVGTTVVIFDHELRAIIDALKGIHTDLMSFASELEEADRPRYETALGELGRWTRSVEQQGSQIGVLLSREARERKQRWALHQSVDEVQEPFRRYMDEQAVEFNNEVPAKLRTPPMYGCELQSVLLNLLTNSLKAVKSSRVRRISVGAELRNGSVRILFRDTGTGVQPTMREEVFKPFVTTSEPDPVLGVGTGLGLKIVRDLLDVYGGTIRFIEPDGPWKACAEMTLPLRSQ